MAKKVLDFKLEFGKEEIMRILMHDGQRFNTMVDNVLIMMDTNLKTFKKAIILV